MTCLADQLWPSAAVGAVDVLRRLGCAVEFDERQTCCGQPAFNTGYRPAARALARRLIEIFEASAADAIVSPSGSCTAMVHHYDQLFDDARWRERAQGVADGSGIGGVERQAQDLFGRKAGREVLAKIVNQAGGFAGEGWA